MQEPLNIADWWVETVAIAINEPPHLTRMLVETLWNNGWSVEKIQSHLIGLATLQGKRLLFTPNTGRPNEQS